MSQAPIARAVNGVRTHGQNCSLWLIDNGIEGIDTIHPQITDSKGTITDVRWTKLPTLRLCNQLPAAQGNLVQAEYIRLVDNRDNQSFLNGHCQSYMNILLAS